MADHIKIGDIDPWDQQEQTVLGNTDFEFGFPIFEDADLEVYVDATKQTLTTHYSVTGAGSDDGGTVTFVTAPAVGEVITMRRRLAIQRTTDFQDSGEFRAKVINDELDRMTAQIQQIANDIARSLVTAPTDPAGNLTLPTLASRKGKYWLWDATTGDPSLSAGIADVPVSAAMEAVVAAATLAAARTLLGLEIGADVQPYDADTAKTDVAQSFTAPQRADQATVTDGTLDLSAAQNFHYTPAGADTLEFTNDAAGQSGMIYLVNGSNYAITLGSEITGPDGMATDISATGNYLISYWVHTAGGGADTVACSYVKVV